MDFLKKHYEKVTLSVVLLGVVIYAVLLTYRVDEEREKIKKMREEIIQDTALPYKPADWSPQLAMLKQAQAPAKMELSGSHNVFNPVRWQKVGDKLIKVDSTDKIYELFVVTNISQLYFSVVFDGPRGSGDSMRYQFTITDEGAPATGGRKPAIRSLSPVVDARARIDIRNEIKLLEIRGAAASPTEVVVELTGDKERFTLGLGKERSFRRESGFEAAAKFEPEKKVFRALRVNSPLIFAGESYKVIAITKANITIEAILNSRRITTQLTPAP